MKLYNTIIVWDVYTVAESPEEAHSAALATIKGIASDDVLPHSTDAQVEVTNEREIREAWLAERPLVAGDVSDADFETLKGKTTLDVYKLLHTKG